jgi:hypothetical protein
MSFVFFVANRVAYPATDNSTHDCATWSTGNGTYHYATGCTIC